MLKKLKNTSELLQYTPAKLTKGKEWYVSFYAFTPESEKLKRKRIKINHVKTGKVKHAQKLIKRINFELQNGWNPWLEATAKNSYKRFSALENHFLTIAKSPIPE